MTHINQRRGTASQWSTANPVLQLGEVGWETDTLKAKLGDGATAWNSLDYAVQPFEDAALTGNPTAPTPAPGDSDTSIATTAFVQNEISDAFVGYAPLASPAFSGNPTAPTPDTADDDTSIATTAFVKAQNYVTADSPALVGTPTAPTPATGDNDTSIATTAFVKAQNYIGADSPALTGNPTAPTPSVGDDDTSIATTAFVVAAREDTGWVDITLNTAGNWSFSGGVQPQYRVRDGRCSLRGVIVRTSGTDVNAFTLPVGVRPITYAHRGLVRTDSGDVATFFTVDVDGDCFIAETQYTSTQYISLGAMSPFFVD